MNLDRYYNIVQFQKGHNLLQNNNINKCLCEHVVA